MRSLLALLAGASGVTAARRNLAGDFFDPSHIAVLKFGSSSSPVANDTDTAVPITLDVIDPSTASIVSSPAISTTVAKTGIFCNAWGRVNDYSTGYFARSSDGMYLAIPCGNVAEGGDITSPTVSAVAAVLSPDNSVSATLVSSFNGGASKVTAAGIVTGSPWDLYVGGDVPTGVALQSGGAGAFTQLGANPPAVRSVTMWNGKPFFAVAYTGIQRAVTSSGSTVYTSLSGIPDPALVSVFSPYQFVFESSASLWTTDTRAYASASVYHYTLASGTWTLQTSVLFVDAPVTGLLGRCESSGGDFVLYGSTSAAVYRYSTKAGGTASLLQVAPAGTAYRALSLLPSSAGAGVAVCPSVTPTVTSTPSRTPSTSVSSSTSTTPSTSATPTRSTTPSTSVSPSVTPSRSGSPTTSASVTATVSATMTPGVVSDASIAVLLAGDSTYPATDASTAALPLSVAFFGQADGVVSRIVDFPETVSEAPAGHMVCTGEGGASTRGLGMLSRSVDGRFLAVPCLSAPVNTSISFGGMSPPTAVVGLLTASGYVDTRTAMTNFAVPPRAASYDASATGSFNVYLGGSADDATLAAGGAFMRSLDGSATAGSAITLATMSIRALTPYQGFLYVSGVPPTSSSNNDRGIFMVTAQTTPLVALPGIPDSNVDHLIDPYQFAFESDTSLWTTDAASAIAAVYQYTFSGTTWGLGQSIAISQALGPLASPVQGLVGRCMGGVFTLFASNKAAVWRVNTVTLDVTMLGAAPAGTVIRSLALAPIDFATTPKPNEVCASPSPTPSTSASSTASRTPSRSVTGSTTVSMTPTVSVTPSTSVTPSVTPSTSASPTTTPSTSVSPTRTSARTPTTTPSTSQTATVTPTASRAANPPAMAIGILQVGTSDWPASVVSSIAVPASLLVMSPSDSSPSEEIKLPSLAGGLSPLGNPCTAPAFKSQFAFGLMTRSVRYDALLIPCSAARLGGDVSTSNNTVATVSSSGYVTTDTLVPPTLVSQGALRSVAGDMATVAGGLYLGSSPGGVVNYVPGTGATANVSYTFTVRGMRVYDGVVYASATDGIARLGAVGSSGPFTTTWLPGIPATTPFEPYQFAWESPSALWTTDVHAAATASIYRYDYSTASSSWSLGASVLLAATPFTGLIVRCESPYPQVVVYASSASYVYRYWPATGSKTLMYSAPSYAAFKSLALLPQSDASAAAAEEVCPVFSPSPTPTATPSTSISASVTTTRTPSTSTTVTSMASTSPSRTPTPSTSPSASASVTPSASRTPSTTAAITPSTSPTATVSTSPYPVPTNFVFALAVGNAVNAASSGANLALPQSVLALDTVTASLHRTFAMDTDPSANACFGVSGTGAGLGGFMTLAEDGLTLLVPCYKTVAMGDLVTQGTVLHGVTELDGFGSVYATTTNTAVTAESPYALLQSTTVSSTNAVVFNRANGLYSIAGAVSTLVYNNGDIRYSLVFGSDLYVSVGTAASDPAGIYKFSGIPTTATTPTALSGVTMTSFSPYAFVFEAATKLWTTSTHDPTGASLYLFTFSGSTWTRSTSVQLTIDPIASVAGRCTRDVFMLYACSASRVYAYDQRTGVVTTLQTAGTGVAFRSVMVPPVQAAGDLANDVCPTPSVSPSITPSRSTSPASSVTASASRSSSMTSSASVTATVTPSRSVTATSTVSSTASASTSPSVTMTASVTIGAIPGWAIAALRVGKAGVSPVTAGQSSAVGVDFVAIDSSTWTGRVDRSTLFPSTAAEAGGGASACTLPWASVWSGQGALALSDDGTKLLVPCTNTDYASVPPTTGGSVTVGVVTSSGYPLTNGVSIPAANLGSGTLASVSSLTGGASAGTYYVGATGDLSLSSASAGTSLLSGSSPAVRAVVKFEGKLYVSSANAAMRGIFAVGSGWPTTGTTAVALPGVPDAALATTFSPFQFAFESDTSLWTTETSAPTLYNIQQYTRSSSSSSFAFARSVRVTAATSERVTGLVGRCETSWGAGGFVLYAASQSTIYRYDPSVGLSSVKALATAPTNTQYRSLALSPLAAGRTAASIVCASPSPSASPSTTASASSSPSYVPPSSTPSVTPSGSPTPTATPSPIPIPPGSITLVRIGARNYPAGLGSRTVPVYLDVVSTSGAGVTKSFALPTAAPSASEYPCTLPGTASSLDVGHATRTLDGRSIWLPCLAAGVAAATSATTPRIFGRIDAFGFTNTSIGFTGAYGTGTSYGSVLETTALGAGSTLLAGGAADGIVEVDAWPGVDTAPLTIAAGYSVRAMLQWSGKVFFSGVETSSSTASIFKLAPATSTASQLTGLPGGLASFSPYEFSFTAPGVLWTTDVGAAATASLRRFDLNSATSTWGLTTSKLLSATDVFTGLVGRCEYTTLSYAGSTVLYVSSTTSLYRYDVASDAATVLATAAPFAAFRGVVLGPEANGQAIDAFVCPSPSVTPSATVTPTSSVTVTITPTTSITVTATITPSVTLSPSNTATPSTSVTASASVTSSRSATPTNSKTPSTSVTPSGSVTATVLATPSTSITPSSSTSCTPTASVTPSVSSTPSSTMTPSSTVTVTPSTSVTPSSTSTPSSSVTPSASMSSTPSSTVTVTPSVTPSSTVSPSSTVTPSSSVTPSTSASASVTVTPSSTVTPSTSITTSVSTTATATVTVSGSVTASTSATPSSTVTPSVSGSPTSTVTPSSTTSVSSSASSSTTPSVTRTPSVTATPSSTKTPTSSVSRSPTSSATASTSITPTRSTSPSSSVTPSTTTSVSPTSSPRPLDDASVLVSVPFANIAFPRGASGAMNVPLAALRQSLSCLTGMAYSDIFITSIYVVIPGQAPETTVLTNAEGPNGIPAPLGCEKPFVLDLTTANVTAGGVGSSLKRRALAGGAVRGLQGSASATTPSLIVNAKIFIKAAVSASTVLGGVATYETIRAAQASLAAVVSSKVATASSLFAPNSNVLSGSILALGTALQPFLQTMAATVSGLAAVSQRLANNATAANLTVTGLTAKADGTYDGAVAPALMSFFALGAPAAFTADVNVPALRPSVPASASPSGAPPPPVTDDNSGKVIGAIVGSVGGFILITLTVLGVRFCRDNRSKMGARTKARRDERAAWERELVAASAAAGAAGGAPRAGGARAAGSHLEAAAVYGPGGARAAPRAAAPTAAAASASRAAPASRGRTSGTATPRAAGAAAPVVVQNKVVSATKAAAAAAAAARPGAGQPAGGRSVAASGPVASPDGVRRGASPRAAATAAAAPSSGSAVVNDPYLGGVVVAGGAPAAPGAGLAAAVSRSTAFPPTAAGRSPQPLLARGGAGGAQTPAAAGSRAGSVARAGSPASAAPSGRQLVIRGPTTGAAGLWSPQAYTGAVGNKGAAPFHL